MKLKWREQVAVVFEVVALIIRHKGVENTLTFLKGKIARIEKENDLLKKLGKAEFYSCEALKLDQCFVHMSPFWEETLIRMDIKDLQPFLEAFMHELMKTITARADVKGKN